jgi:Lariat debranching enzyme, C-terminal domain.
VVFALQGLVAFTKSRDYDMGRFEKPPYDNSALRSVYHVRSVEVARLKLLERIQNNSAKVEGNQPVVDIMISHDWPRGIEQHGDTAGLVRRKQFFEKEILENNLGSPSNEQLLIALKPKWWFAAHLHVKFQANFVHDNSSQQQSSLENSVDNPSTCDTTFISLESSERACSSIKGQHQPDLTEQMTRFLSLDKCLPRRHHLQIVNMSNESDVPHEPESITTSACLHYDLEWLAVLQKTHHWTKSLRARFPEPNLDEVVITENDIDAIRVKLVQSGSGNNDDPTIIPSNFAMTLQPHGSFGSDQHVNQGQMIGNPQTDKLLNLLSMDHKITVPYIYQVGLIGKNMKSSLITNEDVTDDNEIDLDDV